jgi:hypothetical protein
MILYEGPSQLDGSPIVVIATVTKSDNPKTGNVIQTWILRSDISPTDAVKTGQDSSICGDCPHRGSETRKRSCYVVVHQAPQSVWHAYRRGRYPRAADSDAIAALAAGRTVRLGSYGDPAAAPFEVCRALVSRAAGHVGYTHQWRTCDPAYASLLMASADKPADRVAANLKGYRTFRVRSPEQPLDRHEVVCPASAEAGFRTTCAACRACGGHAAKARVDIAILAHGPRAKPALELARS